MKTEEITLEPVRGTLKAKKSKDRVLIVDVLRIIAIFLIVVEHLFASRIYPWLDVYYLRIEILDIFQISYGTIGILLFVFTSGLSLALNYPIVTKEHLKDFYKGRFLRIYPAYWIAIVFVILINPAVLNQSFNSLDVLKLVSGTEIFPTFSLESLKIDNNFWFITLILQLYLLYPLILYAINKKPKLSMAALMAISTFSCYLVADYLFLPNNWVVFSFLFFFGLGIALTKSSLYPMWINRSKILATLSDISFYLYLLNAPLLFLAYNMVLFTAVLSSLAFVFLLIDTNLKSVLKKFVD